VKKIIFSLLLCLGLLIAAVFLFAKDVDITLSEAEAQRLINEKIESDNVIRYFGIDVKITRAIIDFKPDNRIALNTEFSTEGFGYSSNISGMFNSGLRYSEPKIYLKDITPVEYKVHYDDKTQDELNDIKNIASDFLKRKQSEMLSDDAKASLENVSNRTGEKLKEAVRSKTYAFFERLPLYNLNDAGVKASVVKLALKDIQFTEDTAILTLSSVQAMIKILMFVFTVMIVLIYIFQNAIVTFISRKSLNDS